MHTIQIKNGLDFQISQKDDQIIFSKVVSGVIVNTIEYTLSELNQEYYTHFESVQDLLLSIKNCDPAKLKMVYLYLFENTNLYHIKHLAIIFQMINGELEKEQHPELTEPTNVDSSFRTKLTIYKLDNHITITFHLFLNDSVRVFTFKKEYINKVLLLNASISLESVQNTLGRHLTRRLISYYLDQEFEPEKEYLQVIKPINRKYKIGLL